MKTEFLVIFLCCFVFVVAFVRKTPICVNQFNPYGDCYQFFGDTQDSYHKRNRGKVTRSSKIENIFFVKFLNDEDTRIRVKRNHKPLNLILVAAPWGGTMKWVIDRLNLKVVIKRIYTNQPVEFGEGWEGMNLPEIIFGRYPVVYGMYSEIYGDEKHEREKFISFFETQTGEPWTSVDFCNSARSVTIINENELCRGEIIALGVGIPLGVIFVVVMTGCALCGVFAFACWLRNCGNHQSLNDGEVDSLIEEYGNGFGGINEGYYQVEEKKNFSINSKREEKKKIPVRKDGLINVHQGSLEYSSDGSSVPNFSVYDFYEED